MKGVLLAMLLAASPAATAAGAQTVYKYTKTDGSVVYSDRPPADGKVDRIIEFPDLPSSPVPPLAVVSIPDGRSRISGAYPALMMQTPQGARVVQWELLPPPPGQLSIPVEVDAPRPEPAQPPPPPVTLYSAVWCGYCRRAKQYLAEHHIAYFNVDIDTEQGRAEFDDQGGGGVPLLKAGRSKLRGFKAQGYDAFFASR